MDLNSRVRLPAPAGGWKKLEVRVTDGDNEVARAMIEHVGIGEIFLIAGQSNSANHGEEKLMPKTDRVVAFDGTKWQVANDPQPGASGKGGSFIPAFGDALVDKLNVPVGIVAWASVQPAFANGFPLVLDFLTLQPSRTRRADFRWSMDQ